MINDFSEPHYVKSGELSIDLWDEDALNYDGSIEEMRLTLITHELGIELTSVACFFLRRQVNYSLPGSS